MTPAFGLISTRHVCLRVGLISHFAGFFLLSLPFVHHANTFSSSSKLPIYRELKSVTIWFQNKRQSIKRSVLSNTAAPSRSSSSSDDSVSDGRSSPTLAFWSSVEPMSVEPESEVEAKPVPMVTDEEDVQYKETVAAQALCDLLLSAPRHHAPTRTPSAEP